MPPRDMMLAPRPWNLMITKARRIETGIDTMATKRRAEVKKEHQAHQRHHDRLLDQGMCQGFDRTLDESGAVVGDGDLDILRQAQP